MNFFRWYIAADKTPPMYGWYHIMWWVFFIGLLVGAYFLRNRGEKTTKIILLGVGFYLLFWEVLKQIVLIVHADGYNWHHFPLQPCSISMYVIIALGFMKPGKVKTYLTAFAAHFCFFWGMCAVIFPDAIFNDDAHSMVMLWQSIQHHVLMAAIGVYLFMSNKVQSGLQSYKQAVIVFVAFVLLFLLFNAWIQNALPNGAYINAMYSGPFLMFEIPLVSSFVTVTNYTLYLPFFIFINSATVLAVCPIMAGCKRIYLRVTGRSFPAAGIDKRV